MGLVQQSCSLLLLLAFLPQVGQLDSFKRFKKWKVIMEMVATSEVYGM
jgi:hypothetical protein